MKRKVGHRENSFLNGEWGKHVRAWGKKYTAGIRRMFDKKVVRDEVKLIEDQDWDLLNEENRPTLPPDYFKHLKK